MSDILLLAGVALCLLSVLAAIFALARTEPPRGAAISLVLGIVLLIGGAWLDNRPFGIEALRESGQRLIDGEISLGANTSTEVPPAATPPAAPAPAITTEAPSTEATTEATTEAPASQ